MQNLDNALLSSFLQHFENYRFFEKNMGVGSNPNLLFSTIVQD